jgi:hypothetical protein
MKLFRITYVNDTYFKQEYEQYIFCNGLPTYKQILKRINMIDYCGHEMTDEDYKEFIVGLNNYTKYNIENVEEIPHIIFEN